MSEKIVKKVDIKNRRASFEYFFLEDFTAGLSLTGTEIKSIRQGKVNFQGRLLFVYGWGTVH
jgi:SsrA-binding protein